MPPEVALPTNPRRSLRVAVAPDAPVVVAGVKALLRSADSAVTVVDLPDTVRALSTVDVVLYDPLHGVPAGFGAQANAATPALVGFSWSVRGDTEATARSHGACCLLSKDLSGARILQTLRAVQSGQRTAFVVSTTSDTTARARTRVVDGLTAREVDILQMITEGLSNDEIARGLYLSINSVKTYIRTAYRKIGVTRRPQAVLWGVHHGFGQARPGHGPADDT
ncbi:helix-turn-helix transcriptional regulator [Nocardioides dongxiaopingii]|uniref:helix-turn-helix transcriptional regulator n=1 Tax=Nocardioides dongxiaopingii TaxID=2576036 RepID=UPI0010C764EF|nr:response regulator transcription factor [Nocardioides dongxiaopingii]